MFPLLASGLDTAIFSRYCPGTVLLREHKKGALPFEQYAGPCKREHREVAVG